MELDSTQHRRNTATNDSERKLFFYQVGNIQTFYRSDVVLSREVADETNLTILLGHIS
jgi:hypothetical protein